MRIVYSYTMREEPDRVRAAGPSTRRIGEGSTLADTSADPSPIVLAASSRLRSTPTRRRNGYSPPIHSFNRTCWKSSG